MELLLSELLSFTVKVNIGVSGLSIVIVTVFDGNVWISSLL